MKVATLLMLAGVGLLTLGESAAAQLVIVRPGYVQAPFVRVYRDPFGGAHVRAPFVQVDRPGYYFGPPRRMQYEAPLPARPDFAPPANTPEGQLFDAMAAFQQSLARFDTGATWTAYFALDAGGALSPKRLADLSGQPTPDLVAMLDRFDTIADDEAFEAIARLSAFEQARNALASYVAQSATIEPSNLEELPAPTPN